MARTSFTPTSPPIVLSKQLTATLRCSTGPFSAVKRYGRTRRPAGPSQNPTFGGTATTSIIQPEPKHQYDYKSQSCRLVRTLCSRYRTSQSLLSKDVPSDT